MDTPLLKRAYNLGLKAVPNFAALSEDEIVYYEQHLDELPRAICRGFVLPDGSAGVPVIATATDRTLNWWITKSEEFTAKYFGVVNLREMFAIPVTSLPLPGVIPIFDPGVITNRGMVEKVLKAAGFGVYEEEDVMKYAGSEAYEQPTLHFIENSVRPNSDTMNMSPNQLRATGKSYLRLRGYGLAMGLYHFATEKYLDPETFTWFPEDRLPGGHVAHGYWYPGNQQVRFYRVSPDHRRGYSGARVATPVPLRSS